MSWSQLAPIALLVVSNVFMTFAWYGQLKYPYAPVWVVIPVSWGIAFFEYCLAVPANRIGYGVYSAAQLKTMHEIITLLVFGVFAVTQRSRAQSEARAALARQLGAEAVSAPRIDQAMLLARQAVLLDRSACAESILLRRGCLLRLLRRRRQQTDWARRTRTSERRTGVPEFLSITRGSASPWKDVHRGGIQMERTEGRTLEPWSVDQAICLGRRYRRAEADAQR